jgi:hypothetical protein
VRAAEGAGVCLPRAVSECTPVRAHACASVLPCVCPPTRVRALCAAPPLQGMAVRSGRDIGGSEAPSGDAETAELATHQAQARAQGACGGEVARGHGHAEVRANSPGSPPLSLAALAAAAQVAAAQAAAAAQGARAAVRRTAWPANE